MSLTVGSLFSGIGGLELGLERAGMRTLFQVEIDPYARRVLAKHWPHVLLLEDVRSVGAHNLPRVDVLCGGFPCQDISRAGIGAGLDGERSGLWSEYARVIREIRPRYVLVENVSTLLARGLGRVLGDLAASGYDAEWDCIPAAAIGAPHQRDRLFIVAHAPGVHCLGRPNHAGGGSQGPRAFPESRDGSGLADAGGGWWALEPGVGRVAHGLSHRLVRDRLRVLGNAVVPQAAEWLGHRILAHHAATATREAA